MNANQFLQIDDVKTLQLLKREDFPSFSVVLAKLNKDADHHMHSLIESFFGKTTQEKLFNAMLNKTDETTCICGRPVKFLRIKDGYSKYCSPKCRERDPLVKRKREETCLRKFGSKNAGASDLIKEKIKATNLARYGTNSALSREDVIEKSKKTKKEAIAQIVEKRKATNLEKYGATCTLNNNTVRSKTKITLIEKYGVEHNSQIPSVKEKKREQLFSYRKKSLFEEDVINEIRKLGFTGKIVRNSRSIINPMELDIFIPSLGLAIECNGCYWHSDPWKPKDYHLTKTEAAEAVGVKLIHLFDYEWLHKRPIVIHRLKSALGIAEKIHARKCMVKSITLLEANAFINQYHIQGPAVAKINLGLFYEDRLVAVMNFSKPRFNKRYTWELIRYASSCNVIGGASKLLAAFRKTIPVSDTIITYADRRWSNGNLYNKIGFRLERKSSPGYWYFKGTDFKHRSVFQKHKLPNVLEKFDPAMGEVENMYANGWRRIFDSGTLVFILDNRA